MSERNHSPATGAHLPIDRDTSIRTGHWCDGLHTASEALPLEERIMLDAALTAAMDAVEPDGIDPTIVPAPLDDPASSAIGNPFARPIEIVFIDESIDDQEDLLADVGVSISDNDWQSDPDTGQRSITVEQANRTLIIEVIAADSDGMRAIGDAVAGHDELGAIHVLSHGSQSGFQVGSTSLDAASLSGFSDELAAWGQSLSADGDILLYGCHTADTASGERFVEQIARLTSADVAASDDLTGAARLGGDWDLEVHSGIIDTELVVAQAAQLAFDDVLAPEAGTSLEVPASAFINEPFDFSVRFDNTGDEPGYEPFVQLQVDPGVTIGSADYLGAALDTAPALVWNAGTGTWTDTAGNPASEHPLNAGIPLPADPLVDGVRLLVYELPFGSFVTDQPAATIAFSATLDKADGAEVGQGVQIRAQSGFEYGRDAFDNADTDAPIVGALSTSTITPAVLALDSEADSGGPNAVGDENEHATGPNNPITYQVTLDVANGERLDAVALSDVIRDDLHYLGNLTVAGSATLTNTSVSDAVFGVGSERSWVVNIDSVVGTAVEDDVVITWDAYIPELDASGTAVVDPASGAPAATITDDAQVTATYAGAAQADQAEYDIVPHSLATQKNVTILDSGGNAVARDTVVPGDLLEWTIESQVSDYFSLQDLALVDRFGDGQAYVAGSETLLIREAGTTTGPASIDAADVTLNAIDPATGLTEVRYDIANAIDGGSGRLDGDLATETTVSGKTEFVLTFRTEVQEEFTHANLFGGDASVDVGDRLANEATVSGAVVATGSAMSDASAASVTVSTPTHDKSIYAINGVTGVSALDPEVSPGQSVTYRITIELPTTDVERLVITDYLPLPVFAVPADYTYVDSLNGSPAIPAAGEFGYGPLTDPADFPAGFFDTTGGAPDNLQLTVDAAGNSVQWAYDAFRQDDSSGGVLDLLFTTATADTPFEDGLNLTNQAQVSYDNTNNPQEPLSSIVQIETLAPELAISKGVVAIDASADGTLTPCDTGAGRIQRTGQFGRSVLRHGDLDEPRCLPDRCERPWARCRRSGALRDRAGEHRWFQCHGHHAERYLPRRFHGACRWSEPAGHAWRRHGIERQWCIVRHIRRSGHHGHQLLARQQRADPRAGS